MGERTAALTLSPCRMELGEAGTVRLYFPPDPVTAHQVRRVRPRGLWLAADQCWEFPFEAIQQLHRQFGDRFTMMPALRCWLETTRYPLPPFPGHRQLVEAANPDQPLADGRLLLPHQRHAVRWLLARRGALLADEMGLGKTLSALVAARALARVAQLHIVVLAPASVHGHWRREALAVEVSLHLLSWAAIPQDPPVAAGYVLIADEAHYAQNINTRRTRGLLRLARHPRLRCCWLLSGTPMKNGRPHQLLPLLAAIGHPMARHQRWYELTFCNGHWGERHGRRRWQCDGATHLAELRRLTKPLILYRRKQQCLELPPKIRRLFPIKLNAAEAAAFQLALDRTIANYRCRVAEGEVSTHAEPLAVLTAMRRLGSEAKSPRIAFLLQHLLQQGHAVVVFSNFCQPLRSLHSCVGGVMLSGDHGPAQREQMVSAFRQGEVNLLLATYGAAGCGYNLQRARHVVLLERPWTPGDAQQAEDRCHRIGSRHALVSLWPQLGVADHLVDELIASKLQNIDTLFTDLSIRQARAALVERIRAVLDPP